MHYNWQFTIQHGVLLVFQVQAILHDVSLVLQVRDIKYSMLRQEPLVLVDANDSDQ